MASDAERIHQMLAEIGVLLEELGNDDGDFLLHAFTSDPEYRQHVRESVLEARKRLDSVRERIHDFYPEGQISRVQPPEGPAQQLWMAGLTGPSLGWKHTVFNKLLAKYRVSGTTLWLKRILEFVGTFLGSLSLALPELEAVKEAFGVFGAIAKVSRRKKAGAEGVE